MTETEFIANLPLEGKLLVPDALKDFKFWQDVVALSTTSTITVDRLKTRAKMLRKIGKEEWNVQVLNILARTLGYNNYDTMLEAAKQNGLVIENIRG